MASIEIPSVRGSIRASLAALVALAVSHAAVASDWSNLGGNSARNGLSSARGPDAAQLRWSGAPSSIIAWSPAVEGDRVFVVRQTGFVPNGVPNEAPVVAKSVSTGQTLWTFHCPYQSGDWTTVLYGVKNGRVFVGRGGNGSSANAPVHCLDAATGALLWVSASEVGTGSYDGVAFADNGDPIFATHQYVRRISAQTGATVWNSTRNCSVSGDCGPAIAGDAVYVDEVGPGGQIITRFDLATGARKYSSAVMPGFTSQNTPMCGPDGLVFYARTQSNQAVDFMFAFRDTGKALTTLWSHPASAGAGSNHGITPDGGVVMVSYEKKLQVRDQVTGALRHESADVVYTGILQSHVAVDSAGRIFYSNGGFPGMLTSFNADLSPRWSLTIDNLNQGGPVLAPDGTLLVAATGTDMRAYYTEPACAPADLDCDGTIGATDLATLLGAWGTAGADINGDGVTNSGDLAALLSAWSSQG